MHNKYIHLQSVCQVHKVLLDNVMAAGIGTATIAEDDYCLCTGVQKTSWSCGSPAFVGSTTSLNMSIHSGC